jgi:tripartite-type tricarboxylate transporter receptor subunit TctC
MTRGRSFMRKSILVSAFAFLCFSLQVSLSDLTRAADYPTKPIELLCPYPAGGTVDMTARLIAEMAPKYLGQPIAVIDKLGAMGSIAAAEVVSSKPDGYKLVILTSAYFALTTKTQKIPFNPGDLEPLSNFMEQRLGVIVKEDSPFKTMDDVIQFARKNPGQLKWGHSGITNQISGILIFKKSGVQTIPVPYKGGPESLAAVLGGHVDLATVTYGVSVDQVRAGKARYLFFYSDKRFSDQPDVPTAIEIGFPETSMPVSFGVYIHKNTPEDIKKKLVNGLKKISEDPACAQGIERFLEVPRFGGPEYMRATIKQIEEVGVPVLKEIGLYIAK